MPPIESDHSCFRQSSESVMSRARCDWLSLFVLFLLLCGSAARPQTVSTMRSLCDEVDKIRVDVFPKVPFPINMAKIAENNPGTKVLAKIMRNPCDRAFIIDDERLETYFQDVPAKLRKQILGRWDEGGFELEEFASVPLRYDANKGQFVVSSRLEKAPQSTKQFYVNMMWAYSALAKELRNRPSALTYGLSGFVAQDYSYAGSNALCPDFETEVAIASLLYPNRVDLLWDAYGDQFSKNSYFSNLKAAIRDIKGASPDKAIELLLEAPEQYHSIAWQQKQKLRDMPAGERPHVPPHMHPAMRILWEILPDTEAGLRETADFASEHVKQATLRLVLVNACYDKLSALTARSGPGIIANAPMILANRADARLPGDDAKGLMKDFYQRKSRAWQDFQQELTNRNQPAGRLGQLGYDPSTLKWLFRLFYNYSLPIRQGQKRLRDSIKKEHPGLSEEELDNELTRQTTKKHIEQWWNSDKFLRQLFERVGWPTVDVRNSDVSRHGKVIELWWKIQRQRTKGDENKEEIKVVLVDPMSCGGGEPVPGVSTDSIVVVKKGPGEAPEEIKLGKIKPGYFVQTVNDINASLSLMKEDWARVVTIHQKKTNAPWKLDSGAPQPLQMGRKQKVRAKLGDNDWAWSLGLPLRAEKDNLLGISPTGPIAKGQQGSFSGEQIKESAPLDEAQGLIIIELSHREVEKVKKTGAEIWGYFANSRLVQTPVHKAKEGVDGEAQVDVPDGLRRLASLAKPRKGKKLGDKVNAFDYRTPNTFVDHIVENRRDQATYFIEISYTLPDGQDSGIRVAEGQRLVTCERRGRELKITDQKKAYQLEVGDSLVCGFGSHGPSLTRITKLEGVERKKPLQVHSLKLQQCPLVRANGILIPVQTEVSVVCSGVAEDSLILTAPDNAAIQIAKQDLIDISDAELIPARGFPFRPASDRRNSLLCYNITLSPRVFWPAQVHKSEREESKRYVRIFTDYATLTCGHLQLVYVTRSDWDSLRAVRASMIKPGDKVVWMCTKGKAPNWSARGEANGDVATAIERAADRVRNGIASASLDAESGSVHLVEVRAVHDMHPTEASEALTFREFSMASKSADPVAQSRPDLLGLRTNIFANGILVNMKLMQLNPEGEDLGKKGSSGGETERPKEPGTGPNHLGQTEVDEVSLPPVKIKYSDDDQKQFARNRNDLFRVWAGLKITASAVRSDIFRRFVAHYFDEAREPSAVYGELHGFYKDYLAARDYLVGTGDARALPAFVKSYLFLATLTYEARARKAGDMLTRDFLCITVRSIEKPPGRGLYSESASCLRDGLKVVRDTLPYVRDRSSTEGFGPIAGAQFPAESFETVLTGTFIGPGQKTITEGKKEVEIERFDLSHDIYSTSDKAVKLYDLCLQLDVWSGAGAALPKSLIAPDLNPANLFSESAEFSSKLVVGLKNSK